MDKDQAEGGGVTPADDLPGIDAAAKIIAEIFGYAWDGLREESIVPRGFKPFHYSSFGGMQIQGGRDDLRTVARRIVAAAASPSATNAPLDVLYTDCRNTSTLRTVIPLYLWFGSTERHPEPQLLLRAHDLVEGEDRDFVIVELSEAGPPPAAPDDDAHRCFICGRPFERGQMVLPDVEEGLGHLACYGPDRDSYVKDLDTGEPLGPDDPIPTGSPYDPDEYR